MTEWTIPVSEALAAELARSFELGPIADDQGQRFLIEKVVGHIEGLTVEIFAREEGEPHFRVRVAGETARFTPRRCRPLDGDALWRFQRNIRRWWSEKKPALIEAWNSLRPTDCPVGPYRE